MLDSEFRVVNMFPEYLVGADNMPADRVYISDKEPLFFAEIVETPRPLLHQHGQDSRICRPHDPFGIARMNG